MIKTTFKARVKKVGNSKWILVPSHILKTDMELDERELVNVTLEKEALKSEDDSDKYKAVYLNPVESQISLAEFNA